jgi:CheY-like chemotaxis protein
MLKVMIAEDDLIIADLLNDVLVDGGYEVCGIARTVNEAVELGELHKPDLAVLDIRLAEGGFGMEVAARLSHQPKLGVLYASGHIGQMGLMKADGSACISKPYRAQDVVRALKIVEQIISTGEASRPFPKGFELLNGSAKSRTATIPVNSDFRVIRRLRRQQEVLAEFGSFALVEHNLSKVLTEAARACAEGLEVAFCKICRYRSEEDDLLIEAGVGWHDGIIKSATSRADENSPAGRAFVTEKPVVCGDVTKDSSFMLPSFYAEHGIVSTLDVIINREGQPYGVLEIDSPVQHDYDQNDINFVTGFANVVAEAVNGSKRNATLVTSIEYRT